jgi:hypothetical protein
VSLRGPKKRVAEETTGRDFFLWGRRGFTAKRERTAVAPVAAASAAVLAVLAHFVVLDGDLLGEAAHVTAHRRVPVVLDGVVGPAGEELRDLGPLVAQPLLRLVNGLLLLLAPGLLLDRRVEVVQPARAALLATAAHPGDLLVQLLRDDGPPLRAVLLHQPHDCVVLFARPGPALRAVRHGSAHVHCPCISNPWQYCIFCSAVQP